MWWVARPVSLPRCAVPVEFFFAVIAIVLIVIVYVAWHFLCRASCTEYIKNRNLRERKRKQGRAASGLSEMFLAGDINGDVSRPPQIPLARSNSYRSSMRRGGAASPTRAQALRKDFSLSVRFEDLGLVVKSTGATVRSA